MRVDDVARDVALGSGRIYSLRQIIPFNSRSKCSECVWMTRQAPSGGPRPDPLAIQRPAHVHVQNGFVQIQFLLF
jgi:hypothetical protein